MKKATPDLSFPVSRANFKEHFGLAMELVEKFQKDLKDMAQDMELQKKNPQWSVFRGHLENIKESGDYLPEVFAAIGALPSYPVVRGLTVQFENLVELKWGQKIDLEGEIRERTEKVIKRWESRLKAEPWEKEITFVFSFKDVDTHSWVGNVFFDFGYYRTAKVDADIIVFQGESYQQNTLTLELHFNDSGEVLNGHVINNAIRMLLESVRI